MLSRKISKLFSHVKDTIKQAGLATTIGQEYSALLRTHLLTVDAYCNAVSCASFEGRLSLTWLGPDGKAGCPPQVLKVLDCFC